MKTMLLSVLTAATLALAGCAAGSAEPDVADDGAQQQATTAGDRINVVQNPTADIGARGGIAVADDPQHRMYDFDKTPRFAQRAPYTVDLQELQQVGVIVTHAGDGTEIQRSIGDACGLGCARGQ